MKLNQMFALHFLTNDLYKVSLHCIQEAPLGLYDISNNFLRLSSSFDLEATS